MVLRPIKDTEKIKIRKGVDEIDEMIGNSDDELEELEEIEKQQRAVEEKIKKIKSQESEKTESKDHENLNLNKQEVLDIIQGSLNRISMLVNMLREG